MEFGSAGLNVIFLIFTGAIACHALTYRDAEGGRDPVRLLFGCIALLFFMRVLFHDVLELWK